MKVKHFRSLLVGLFIIFFSVSVWGQTCEPNYSVPYMTVNNAAATGNTNSQLFNLKLTVGQPMIQQATNYSQHSMVGGLWSFYMKEPRPPIVRASDGDFQDMVLVQWTIEDDHTGPPVTGANVVLYRNGYVLSTLPVSQTDYQDFNVFPGEYYQYGVVSTNEMGTSHKENNIGFMNPNGVITGHVETPSGNPVEDTKVMLTPNLGRSAFFGPGEHSYVYYIDPETSLNRLFVGLEESYTIETWFRSTHTDHVQTLFAAVDSSTVDHYLKLELLEGGYLHWEHNPAAGITGTEITTVNPYSGFDEWGNGRWHHVACVFDTLEMTMYVDGFIVGEAIATGYIADQAEIMIGKSAPMDPTNYYYGRMDDFRIWSIPREWEDLRKYQDITLSGDEEGLAAYWKFDEVEGDIVFDLTQNDNDGEICHITRSPNLAPVYVGALTDSVGNYAIRGIYYGGGTTFTVTPSKQTNIGRALELNGADQFVSFYGVRVDMVFGYTQEGWFKTAETQAQVLFSATDPANDELRLRVEMTPEGYIRGTHFTTELQNSENMADNLWHHYAVSYDQETFRLYIDGQLAEEAADANTIPDLSEIVMGRAAPEEDDLYFNGRIDEMRLWNLCRNYDQINGTKNQVLEGDEYGLANYWKMNEGGDLLVTDATGNIATGTLENGVVWTEDIPLIEMFEHYYEPESRQASLNASNTSVDMVNFTDISMIPISGYVRYESTACFQDEVQILVNGVSLVPPIYTDADGKWIIELEPGSTGDIIQPVFELHEFIPPFIELPLIASPRTGLYFSDQEFREITGKVAGGSCRFPITPSQGQIEVTVRAVNGCIEKSVVPHPVTGEYKIEDLPPFIYQIWIDHPNPEIDAFFDAETLSLEEEDRVYDFIYYAPPDVAVSGIPEGGTITLPDESEISGVGLLTMNNYYTFDIEIYESYSTWLEGETVINTCPVDSGYVRVLDYFGNNIDTTAVFTDGAIEYSCLVREPNILSGGDHPYQKQFTVIATDNYDRQAQITEWAIVTGNKPRTSAFTTTTPEIPIMILRDPPGDHSYSYLSTTETHSMSVGISMIHNDNSSEFINAYLGVDVTTEIGFIVSTEIAVDVTLDFNYSTAMTTTNSSQQEQTWTISTTEAIQTSAENTFVGQDGDLYMGGAMNLLYGITDILDVTDGVLSLDADIIIAPQGFATNYLYSEYHILNSLIPSLELIGDEESAARWQSFVDSNHDLKESASLIENRSFDAGATYEYTETEETSETVSYQFETFINEETAFAAGIEVNGVGVVGGFMIGTEITMGESSSETTTHSNTVGFVLADDDIGDSFTLDVKWDGTYGTPVFETITGASSNPWEDGTQMRDQPSLDITPAAQVNVSPDEAASFTMLLGNLSETEEQREYWFRVINTSNPDGAQISVNGIPIEDHLSYYIPYGEQVENILSIERGPVEYIYNNLQFMLVPPGQYAVWENGGPMELAAYAQVSVEFQQPASEVHIAVPQDNWLITSADEGDTLWVTMDGYNRFATNLVSIDLKYRPSTSGRGDSGGETPELSAAFGEEKKRQSDSVSSLFAEAQTNENNEEHSFDERTGEWFTAYSVLVENITEDYIIMPWNISPSIVVDGAYELRAITVSTGDSGDGYSNIVTGLIDREGPEIFGSPEPVDGILSPDDQIAIHFNENINGALISQGNQDIALFNTTTGQMVDFDFTFGFNTITVEPAVNNEWIENQTLRVDINVLEDMHGNSIAEPISWEFFVNRNPVEWLGESIHEVIYVDQTVQTSRILRNIGGSNRSYELIGGRDNGWPSGEPLPLPDWLEFSPIEGILTPGEERSISINLVDDAAAGQHNTTIYANAVMGDEPLIIDIRILDYPPEWSFDMTDFEFSMNMTAVLAVDNILSDDVYDIVGVFVDDECRGVGEISYIPTLENELGLHPYETFISIYSNQLEGEILSFRVWDASESTVLGNIVESYEFVANSVLGNPTAPVTITATNQVIKSVKINDGWNWLSFNLTKADMGINSFLESLTPTGNDMIKTQSSFAQFVEYYGWVGNMTQISTSTMYLLRMAEDDTLQITGYPVNVETDTLFVSPGWNWISYLPQYSMELNYALNSLDGLTTGDIIKSQAGFAQFVENMGWFGNMQFLQPNKGYLMRLTYPGELVYPFEIVPLAGMPEDIALSLYSESDLRAVQEDEPDWQVIPELYEYNMNIIAVVMQDGMEAANETDMIAAFYGDECRGVTTPVYLEAFDRNLVFMTVYGNVDEDISFNFKYFNSLTSQTYDLEETIDFAANDVFGSILEPYALHTLPLTDGDENLIPVLETRLQALYPNPFNPELHIKYSLSENTPVEIVMFNIKGQKVKTLVNETQESGWYHLSWTGDNDDHNPIASGVYFLQIKADGYQEMRKVLLMK
ncbi:MAG: T9SS type A sorting domain-containing protein [Candidatus Cloacimonetes bacterium]|nr:T9SS type A sorting domain-containing protein [Candidatus Cloacimonadota bacterium]